MKHGNINKTIETMFYYALSSGKPEDKKRMQTLIDRVRRGEELTLLKRMIEDSEKK